MLNITQIRAMRHKIHAAMIEAAKKSKTDSEGAGAVTLFNHRGDAVLIITHTRHVPGINYSANEHNGFAFFILHTNGWDIRESQDVFLVLREAA